MTLFTLDFDVEMYQHFIAFVYYNHRLFMFSISQHDIALLAVKSILSTCRLKCCLYVGNVFGNSSSFSVLWLLGHTGYSPWLKHLIGCCC